MKLNFKMIAAAAAMVVAGGAHADIVTTGVQSGQLVLFAFNTVTNAYYIRDLGYTINTFLPTGVSTSAADGGGAVVNGDKSPEAGLTLDKTSNANFADTTGNWSSFVNGATLSDIRWAVSATDALGINAAAGVTRLITSSAAAPALTNGQVSNYTTGGAAGGLGGLFNPVDNGLSAVFASGAPSPMFNNFGLGAQTLSALDAGVGLWYNIRSQSGSANAAGASPQFGYSNSANTAVITLESDGDFSYTLAPAAAVPLPAAAWMMGAGLLGIGGMIRRRRAAAQA